MESMETNKFNIGDQVYLIVLFGQSKSPMIATGRVVSVHKLDELNYKYIVSGHNFTWEAYDSKVYATPKELIQDFCSVILS